MSKDPHINSWDFVILGADGQQGQIVSRYLHNKGYKIVCVDIYTESIERIFANKRDVTILKNNCADISNVKNLLTAYAPKVLLNLTYEQSLPLVEQCIERGVYFLDIFANYDWVDKLGRKEDMYSIHKTSKLNNTVVLTGCGCAPGITSLMAKKIGAYFKKIKTIEAGFSWDSNTTAFVPPFCMSDAAYELFYDTRVIVSKKDKIVEPLSVCREYDFPVLGKKKVYAISHIELYSFLEYFEDKDIENVFFYGGFPEHCMQVLLSLDKLGLIENKEKNIAIFNQESKLSIFTCQDIITAISKNIKTPENYTETEIVWCTITGKDYNDREAVKTMYCIVPPIKGWEMHGCNVDTGVPAAVIAEMMFEGVFSSGVYMPEFVVDSDLFIQELEKFGFGFNILERFL